MFFVSGWEFFGKNWGGIFLSELFNQLVFDLRCQGKLFDLSAQ